MIKSLEKSARTEDAAITAALEELGLDRDDVSVEIIARAKSGFLGIGASNAIVRVSYEVPDEPKKEIKQEKKPQKPHKPQKSAQKQNAPEQAEAKQNAPKQAPVRQEAPRQEVKIQSSAAPEDEKKEYAEIRQFLTGLFERMDITADIDIKARQGGGVDVSLSGDSIGAIIGRRGETLDAIQHLTNYVVNHGNEKHKHINIDAESYRAKREEALTRLAEKMAEKAIKYKRNMALEPMNSYERHIIHTALQNYDGVTTASTGEEPNRRVVVTYVKKDSEETNKPKFKEWA